MSLHTHADHLERWLGAEKVANLSASMRDWYGPPIAIHGIPGNVHAVKGGEFIGKIERGFFASAQDRADEIVKRELRLRRARMHRVFRGRRQLGTIGSFNEAIAAGFGTGRREFLFNKAGTLGVVAATNTLWYVGAQPAAGANGGAAPGGTAMTDATTGAFPFDNPSSGTQHFVFGNPVASVAANTLLLYDRLFSVTKTMNNSGTEAVTGVPTRYQSAIAANADYAGGNFLMIECRTVLPNTAHNWTVCTYTDEAGNTGATLPSVTGNAQNIVNRLDQPLSTWFCPLATGDVGIKALTQMQCSALVATGAIDFTIGHALAFMPCGIANFVCEKDGLTTSFNLARIFDDACMAFLEICKSATTLTTYTGSFVTLRG